MADRDVVIQVAETIRGTAGAPGAPGAPSAWGAIPGNINDQVDLQAQLALKRNSADLLSNAGFTLIKHKKAGANTFARTAAQLLAVGGADEQSVMHYIDPDLDDELIAGTLATSVSTMLANAIAALHPTEGGRLFFPAPFRFFTDDQLWINKPKILLDMRGATIDADLSVLNDRPVLKITFDDCTLLGGTIQESGDADQTWQLEVTGKRLTIEGTHLTKPNRTSGGSSYQAYFRYGADGALVRGLRTSLADGIYIESSNNSWIGCDIDNEHPGGDDAFVIKAIQGITENNKFIGNTVRHAAAIVSIGSEIGVQGANDATHSKQARGITLLGNNGDRCSSLLLAKPGAIASVDYRDGHAHSIFIGYNTLIDTAGIKFNTGIDLRASRGSWLSSITGDHNRIVARTYDNEASGHKRGLEILAFDGPTGGTPQIWDIDLGMEFHDPYNGVAAGGSAPGHPIEYGASVTDDTAAGGAIRDVNLRLVINGSRSSGVLIGDGLDNVVHLEKVETTNVNTAGGFGDASLRIGSIVELGHYSLSPNTIETFGTGDIKYDYISNAIIPTDTFLGRTTAGDGIPELLTGADAKAILNIGAGDITGLGYFATGTDAVNLSGTLAVGRLPQFTGGDVTTGAAGSVNLSISNGAVSLAKMANVASGTVFYRKTASAGAPETQTLATLKTDLGLAGTNSGDQTSIAGISGTKAQFDTALSDGNFLFVGDVTAYTDENAQDAVGAMIVDTATIDLTYTDATPELKADVKDDSINFAKLLNAASAGIIWAAGPGDYAHNASGGGTTNFLRADGAWAVPPGSGGGVADGDKGDVNVSSGATVWTVQSAAGAFDVAGHAELADSLRVTGSATTPSSGSGVEIIFGGVTGTISARERGGANAWHTLALRGVGIDIKPSGNTTVLFAADGTQFLSITAPLTAPVDRTNFVPCRLNASGGRVWPRFKGEDAVIITTATHPGRNAIVAAQAIGNATTAIAPVGMAALTAVGTATARNVASTSRLTKAKRLAYLSAGTAGAAGGLHNGTATTQYFIGGAAGGGFLAIFRFAVSDASLVSGAHAIIGFRSATGAPAVATNPNTLTNLFALAQTNGSANWQIVYGGSAAQTPVDTGMAVNNTDLLEFTLYARPDVNNKITWRLENITSGVIVSGELTGTAGTALPANTTALGPVIWRSNNATASAVGIDIAGYYIESDIA